MFDDALLAQANKILDTLRLRKMRIVTAESCTGGLIAGLLTAIPGSSDVVDRGFVTYSNAAKASMLAVPADLIEAEGAVSSSVAIRMAEGALKRSEAEIAVSVTGIAGPGGGSPSKPVGLVFIGTAVATRLSGNEPGARFQRYVFADKSRDEVRRETVLAALSDVARRLAQIPNG